MTFGLYVLGCLFNIWLIWLVDREEHLNITPIDVKQAIKLSLIVLSSWLFIPLCGLISVMGGDTRKWD